MKRSNRQITQKESKTADRPRTKPAEVRRRELLNAAEALFVSQGVAATSVDQIVAAADVSKGAFYLHFPSKEALLAALQQRFVEEFRADFQSAMGQRRPDDWDGRLRAWVDAGVNGYLDRLALHDIVFHEFRPENPREKHENPIVTDLAECLKAGNRAGVWSVREPRLTAIMLFSALHGAVDDAISSNLEIHRKKLTASVEKLFRRVVGLA